MKLALLVLALTLGCLRTTTFHCTGDADCTNGSISGMCQSTTSLCSFPDSSCTSGQRYGDLSGSLANKCTDTSSPMPDAPAGYFYVGGTVSGLTGSVVLRDNGGDDLTRSSNGPFQFATALQTGMSYAVTVGTQPSMQTCTVASGTGTIASADVTNVAVTCASGDVGIFCGGTNYCSAISQVCCNPAGTASCTTSGACGSTKMSCDDAADCVGSAGGSICCARYANNGNYQGSQCQTSCNTPSQPMCDPSVATPCAAGTCKAAAKLPVGYHTCQ